MVCRCAVARCWKSTEVDARAERLWHEGEGAEKTKAEKTRSGGPGHQEKEKEKRGGGLEAHRYESERSWSCRGV